MLHSVLDFVTVSAERRRLFVSLLLVVSFFTVVNGVLGLYFAQRLFLVGDTLRNLLIDMLFVLFISCLPRFAVAAVAGIVSVSLLGTGILAVSHLLIYKVAISKFAIESVVETTPSEALEFVKEYIVTGKSVVLVTLCAGYLFAVGKLFRRIARTGGGNVRPRAVFATVSAIVLACISWKFYATHPSILAYNSLYSYYREMDQMEAVHATRESIQLRNVSLRDTQDKSTVVLVIGESANRKHHGFAGYFRNTTPLTGADASLIKYTDVISPDTHTIPALRRVLLLGMKKKDDQFWTCPSMLQLFNAAGYSTFWISNQSVNKDGTTGTKLIAEDATKTIFLNRAHDERKTTNYDEIVLPEVTRALADPAQRKAIFVHLLGSHLTYALRYPSSYDVFRSGQDIPDSPFKTDEAVPFINAYDNSILYTDFVVEELAKLARQASGPVVFVYFADHGQEVYDSRAVKGHSTNDPSKHMYDVPFMIFCSEAYKTLHPDIYARIQRYASRPATTAEFTQGMADLLGIGFDGFDPAKSIFADQYAPGVRKASNGAIYDSLPY